MATRLALCAAVSAVVIGAAAIASAAENPKSGGHGGGGGGRGGGGGGHVSVSHTNFTRTNVSRNVSHTNVSHTNVSHTTTTTTRFHKTNVTNTQVTHQQFHTNTGLRPPLKQTPKAVQALNVSVPKAVQAQQLHQLQHGPGPIGAVKNGVFVPGVKLANNRFAPIWKGPHRIWWGGRWRVFAPFTALSAVIVAGHY